MRKIFILLLLLLSNLAHAQNHVLKGKIGSFPIVMILSDNEGEYVGTYFYTSALTDITIFGTKTEPSYTLINKRYDDTTEWFTLTRGNDSTWSGTWKNKEGKQYDVTLTSIDMKGRNAEEQYAAERRGAYKIIKDSTVKNGKYTVEYHHISKSPVYSLSITDGIDKALAKKVNRVLNEEMINESDYYFSHCTFSNSAFDYQIRHTYFSDHLISVVVFFEYDCGHLTEFERAMNFNTDNGELLRLYDVMHLTTPKLIKLAKSMFRKAMYRPGDEGYKICDSYEDESWADANWFFTGKGLKLEPSFPHAALMCTYGELCVPYSVVKKYLNPTKKIILP